MKSGWDGTDIAVEWAVNLDLDTFQECSWAVSQSHEHFEDINQLESATQYLCKGRWR